VIVPVWAAWIAEGVQLDDRNVGDDKRNEGAKGTGPFHPIKAVGKLYVREIERVTGDFRLIPVV